MRLNRTPTTEQLLDYIFRGPQPVETIETIEQLEHLFELTKKDYLEDPSCYEVGLEQLTKEMEFLKKAWERDEIFLGLDCFGDIIVKRGILNQIRQRRQSN